AFSSAGGSRSSSSLLEDHLEVENPSKNKGIEESILLSDKKAIANFITILWNSWNSQNNFIVRGKEKDARVTWERAITLRKDFHINNFIYKLMPLLSPLPKKLEKPLRGTVKINFNAAVSNTKTDYRVIMRDSKGFAIGGSFGFKNEEMASEWVELYAFKESLKLARMLEVTRVTFKTNCATLTNRIKKCGDDINLMGYCINECFYNMDRLYNLAVKWANCNCNKVVDFLSKYAISNEGHLVFGMYFPTVIHNLAIDDVIN
ncbi:hypothetical protein Golob_020090, partial [Gossypium lobatum]|nr:hypothetical protein [Gossypium lobatum]